MQNVPIGRNEKTYRFQCLGCYQSMISYVPMSAAFAQHVADCVPHPFPYELPDDADESALRAMYEAGTLA